MQIYLESLGCAKNLVDSEKMAGLLLKRGFLMTDDPEKADVIVVNTCGFVETAISESVEKVLRLAKFREEGRCTRLIVAGCLAERFKDSLAESMPEVDLFLGTGEFDMIADAVLGKIPVKRGRKKPGNISILDAPELRPATRSLSPYLKIAEGCNRFCSYCIIPKLRGKYRSIAPEHIMEEAAFLVEHGAKELNLVSQETSAWGRDFRIGSSLADLVAGLAKSFPSTWIRILYLHPLSFERSLLEVLKEFTNVCRYLDIPIQHASDRVLKRMKRGYDSGFLRELFKMIKEVVPDVVMRTTVILGFPGETEEDFKNLIEFIGEIGFDNLGAFRYSDFSDLMSHTLLDHVDPVVAEERYEAVMAEQQKISIAKNRRYIGKRIDVLVESVGENGYLNARSMFQAPEVDGVTIIKGDPDQMGRIVKARITDASAYDLYGVVQ